MSREYLNAEADCCDAPDWDLDTLDAYRNHVAGEYECTSCGKRATVRFGRDSFEVYDA